MPDRERGFGSRAAWGAETQLPRTCENSSITAQGGRGGATRRGGWEEDEEDEEAGREGGTRAETARAHTSQPWFAALNLDLKPYNHACSAVGT